MFQMQVCQCPLTQPLPPQLLTLKGKYNPVVEQRNSVISMVMQPVTEKWIECGVHVDVLLLYMYFEMT